MNKKFLSIAALAAGFCSSFARADATLKFDSVDPEGNTMQHSYSILGVFMRIDEPEADKPRYSIMDTGRQLLFKIDDEQKNFSVTRFGYLFWPDAPPQPKLVPTKKIRDVAGVRCRVVNEMGPDGAVAEHCMANSGQLNLSGREVITLSRLFKGARRMGWNWPGVATEDERMISIQSLDLTGKRRFKQQELKSITHERIAKSRIKVPDEYTRLKPDLPVIQQVKKPQPASSQDAKSE